MDNQIKRKNSSKLNSTDIENAFKKRKNKHEDILCQYLYTHPESQKTVVEFFTAEELHHFLFNR